MKQMIIFFLVIIAVVALMTIHEGVVWNDGYCPHCGGRWVFEQAIGGRTTTYLYICEDCGHWYEFPCFYGK